MTKIKDVKLAFKCNENISSPNKAGVDCSKCQCKVLDLRNLNSKKLDKLLDSSEKPICGFLSKSQLSKTFVKYAASTVIAATALTTPVLGQVSEADSIQLYLDEATESDNNDDVFFGIILEQQAEPIGGYQKLLDRLNKELKVPKNLTEKVKVFIQFEVDSAGKVKNAVIVRGYNKKIDKEAMRAFNVTATEFTPARQRGKAIRSRLILPVSFNIKEEDLN